jgi:predicted ATPase
MEAHVIHELILRNFKSIASTKLPLKNLNILIGRNGSGKSNFLNFFHFLQQGANGGDNNAFNSIINSMGGFQQVIHYNASPQDTLSWDLTFRKIRNEEEIFYEGSLARRGSSGYTIRLEEVSRPPYEGYAEKYKYLTVTDGRVRILKSFQDEPETPYDESDQELVIAQVRNRVRYPTLAELRNEIGDWQVFRGFGSDALRNIRTPQVLNPIEPLRLDPSGINLVSILHELKNQVQYESIYEKLVQVMQNVFPDFVQPDIPAAGGLGSLAYRSRDYKVPVPAISMSDGQLRFLGLLILLLLPTPPSLIAIDEPEVGLHPEMLDVFAELLQQAAERTQIIVATHSPRLIDFIAPENVITVERDAGETRLVPVESTHLERWLERYTLGKLWTMGKLEA